MVEHPSRARRRLRRVVALLAVMVPLLSACDVWEQAGRLPDASRFNPEEVGITPSNVASLSAAWSADVTGSFSEPLLSGDRLYTTVVSGGRGSVRAYDVATGAVVWEQPVPAPATPGTPGPVVKVAGELWVSYSGAQGSLCSGVLSRLDPATGNVLATETTGPAIYGPVVASGSTAAFVQRGCTLIPDFRPQLVVRDLLDPAGTWTFLLPDRSQPTPPSISHDKIYVAADNQLYAFDAAGCGAATCVPLWTTSLDLDGVEILSSGERPVVGPDGTVYVGGLTHSVETLVEAFDGETGAHLWHTDRHPGPGPGWQYLALAHDQLYVSDQRQGTPSSAVEVFAAGGCGQPVCAPAWSAAIDGLPVGGLTIGGDVLYVGLLNSTGRLLAFDAHGCGAPTCARIADVGFADRQPLRFAVAGGRVAVVAVHSDAATLRVLVPAA